jgi:hypothetical protein
MGARFFGNLANFNAELADELDHFEESHWGDQPGSHTDTATPADGFE